MSKALPAPRPTPRRRPRPPHGLTALSPEIRAQLEAWLADGKNTLKTIAELMLATFDVKTSATAIHDYSRRLGLYPALPAPASASAPEHAQRHGAFEVIVTAPGASEVRVQIRPIPIPEA